MWTANSELLQEQMGRGLLLAFAKPALFSAAFTFHERNESVRWFPSISASPFARGCARFSPRKSER